MTVMRWTPRQFTVRGPWREIDRLRSHAEEMYQNLVDNLESITKSGAGVYPLLNLFEDSDNLYLTAELPGVNPADLEVSVHGDSLTLRGERKKSEEDETANFHRREREAGFFRRVVSLPVKVDNENVSAAIKNGVLKVTLPKAPEVKIKTISVQAE